MKCVVGVDLERRSGTAIDLLGRLQFSLDETLLVHVTEPAQLTMPYSAYGMFAETDQIYDMLRKSGENVLAEANVEAVKQNLNPKTEMCEGFPTATLCERADQIGASLIAVSSTVRGTISAVFGGSVARGLTIAAHQSVLVAREDALTDEPIRAVFATDQSPYCGECVKEIVKFAPKGISHLTLLTVHERAKHEHHLSLIRHNDAHRVMEEAHQNLTDRGNDIAKWLSESGIPTNSIVESGHVDEMIHKTMKETKANLLIVGSQGHGFLDRVMVGSVSLHQVISERYPVLLLRIPKAH